MTHTDHIRLRLSNERSRLAAATKPGERQLRAVWIAQLERELASELLFTGEQGQPDAIDADALLAELFDTEPTP